MTDKKFAAQYKKDVENIELPVGYKERIISDIRLSQNNNDKKQKTVFLRNRKLIACIAAALVFAIGLTVGLSVGISFSKDKSLSFNVMSATNLAGVPGAKIVFRTPAGKLLKDKNGETLTAVTDKNGTVSITVPITEECSVEISADGFITLEETAASGNFYVSPVMDENTYRAVLTWDKECDLDAHLSITDANSCEKLNYYKSDIKDDSGKVLATLDVDNEIGDGPETVTFNSGENSLCRFSVSSYSALKENSNPSLSEAGAKVTLYRGNSLVGTYTLDKTLDGNVWCVFEIENGGINLRNYTYSVNAVTQIN